uniref:Stage II sporulation protein M n=1 Tax=Ignisphaera aggregans TaxID=334771 RepID=A0A7C2VLH8_9CREN
MRQTKQAISGSRGCQPKVVNMSIRMLMVIMFIVFLWGCFLGSSSLFFLLQTGSEQAEQVFNQVEQILGSMPEIKPYTVDTVLAIFMRNFEVALLSVALGLLVVVPGIIVFVNGFVLGMVLVLVSMNPEASIFAGLAAIIPHGIIELPALFLAASVGTRIGIDFWRYVIKKKDKESLTRLLTFAPLLLLIAVSLLFIASLIETYATPYILETFFGIKIP